MIYIRKQRYGKRKIQKNAELTRQKNSLEGDIRKLKEAMRVMRKGKTWGDTYGLGRRFCGSFGSSADLEIVFDIRIIKRIKTTYKKRLQAVEKQLDEL